MKNRIESIKAKLRNISKKENKNHQLLLTRYFQERFLFRLSKSTVKNHFFLKGGVLIYVFEGEKSRPTLDLDLLAQKIKIDQGKIRDIFHNVCGIKSEEDGVNFDLKTIQSSEIVKDGKYSGIRVKVIVSLGNIRQRMQIDIGFGDIVVLGPVSMTYPTLLEMENPKILAYSIESLVAEKFEAMIDLAELNSRMKDFYDIYRILINSKYNLKVLERAVRSTFTKRSTIYSNNHVLFSNEFQENERRNLQWKTFLRKANLDESIRFSEVMDLISKKLKPIYDRLQN